MAGFLALALVVDISICSATSFITVAAAKCIWVGLSFCPGVNNLHIIKHVAFSSGPRAVVTAVNVSHYLKLRNRISVQVMCLRC